MKRLFCCILACALNALTSTYLFAGSVDYLSNQSAEYIRILPERGYGFG